MGFFQWLKDATCQSDPQIPDGPPAPLTRKRFRFSGTVQGVGFRYEAQRIASRLGLVGWVRNQSDGSVVAEIEGPENDIQAFLLSVQAVPRFDITDIQTEKLPVSKKETAFQILY